jgi:hypothetical protein
LEARIDDLEQRVAELEAGQIPIDPNEPDWITDYFVQARDPMYQFGLVCTIEEQGLPNTGHRLTCIRPAEFQ